MGELLRSYRWMMVAAISVLLLATTTDAWAQIRVPGSFVAHRPNTRTCRGPSPASTITGGQRRMQAVVSSFLLARNTPAKVPPVIPAKSAKQIMAEGPRGILSAIRQLAEVVPMLGTLVAVLDKGWSMLPLALRALISPSDLFLFITTRLMYRKVCRAVHAFHGFLWKRFGLLNPPNPYEDSVLGFVEPKLGTLTNVIGVTYLINVAVALLVDIGWRIPVDSGRLMANIIYIAYAAFFFNEVKKNYLPVWVPSLQEDKRRSYIIDRSSSVVLWVLAVLSCIECVSSYLKVPLSSTLAFGGIGGLAFGLASKDVISNFFGGLMLLFTEPFTPGDMIHFTTRGTFYEGKVERVGWYQTRLRGKDTRPTYVPNSVFVDTMVTNMDRITHRRFEANFGVRYQDAETLPEVILEIKKVLRVLPKVDVMSPFRVHFVNFGQYCLNLQVSCYFATKSLDEYLYLQQCALMEITRVITEKGCRLAIPTTHLDFAARDFGEALVNGVVDYQKEMERAVDSTMAAGGSGRPASVSGSPTDDEPVVRPAPGPGPMPGPAPASAAAPAGATAQGPVTQQAQRVVRSVGVVSLMDDDLGPMPRPVTPNPAMVSGLA